MTVALTVQPRRKKAAPVPYVYHAMGGVLRSEVELPELVPTSGAAAADWTFRVGRGAAPDLPLVPLGERRVGVEAYWLSQIASGFRLKYSHAGIFDITDEGASITWYPSGDNQEELARCILLGPALAIALETAGLLCLHGSAVAISDQAVAFVGGKHHGKSTLAIALTAAGARLISDDIVPVQPGPPAITRPGVASARLWEDSARELINERYVGRTVQGVKSTLTAFAKHALQITPLPLAAIYLLRPDVTGSLESPCVRVRLHGADSVVVLAHQTKLPDPLVGLGRAGARLKLAATIAGSVPIWQLHFVGGFDRLTEVVQQILCWHRDPSSFSRGLTR